MNRILLAFPLLVAAAAPPSFAPGKVGASEGRQQTHQSKSVDYKHGDVALQGYLAWDPSIPGKRPGVIIVHEWKGLGDYAKRRADQIAKLGYIAFAVDMYGRGVFAKDHEEAGKLSGAFFKDRTLMRDRVAAGLEILRKHELCDPDRIAAMGYCFGGTTVLEMARANQPVLGVASFHGNLATPTPAKEIKARVVVFHGEDDKWVGSVPEFESEMKAAKAKFVVVKFPGAVHSFTVKEAGDDPSKGMAYNEEADKKSWDALKEFLTDLFKKK